MNILIVEDDDTTADALSQIFNSIVQFNIKIVITNDDAINYLKEIKPDLITLDKNHPGCSGIDLFNRIKSYPETSTIPIFMISGSITDEEEFELYRSGIEEVFRKPFPYKSLIMKTRQHLNIF
jgi:DNA-binding response OmpR family regulator